MRPEASPGRRRHFPARHTTWLLREPHGIIAALANADVMTFADKAYQGAGGSMRIPVKRHRYRPKLSRRQKAVNKAVNKATPGSAAAANALSPPSRPGRS